jgi:nitroreductase
MNAMETIQTRKSIRAYKPDPVPRRILEQIVEAARYAISWGNSQPWEFAILGGSVMEEVREILYSKPPTGEGFAPDLQYATFSGACKQRVAEITRQIWESFGASPDDEADTRRIMAVMRRNYDAPHMIVVHMDRSLEPIALLALGAAIQLILLAAHHYGMGCCVMAATAGYPDDLRRVLCLPDSKKIIIGISVGYPDMDSPRNKWERQREPLERFTSWHGFE